MLHTGHNNSPMSMFLLKKKKKKTPPIFFSLRFLIFKTEPAANLIQKCEPLAHLIKASFKTCAHLKVHAMLEHFTAKWTSST